MNGYIALVVLLIAVILISAVAWLQRSVNAPRRRQQKSFDEADQLITRAHAAAESAKILMLTRALLLARQSRDGLLCSEAACLLGETYARRGDYQSAIEKFNEALHYQRDFGWYTEKPNFEAYIWRQLNEARANAEHRRQNDAR